MAMKTKVKRSAESEVYLLFNAFDDFLMEKEARNLSTSTIVSYKESFNKFTSFFDFNEDTTTEEITKQLFFKWINTMKHENLSYSSINHYLRDTRAFCYWCMEETRKYIEPAFKIELVKGQEEAPKTFTDEEVETLLVKPHPRASFPEWRTWAIIHWVLGTGARAGTVCNVKIKDIDFKRKEITYAHTKNKKAQVIPLSSSTETAIKEFIRVWRKEADKESYLFCNIGEEQLTTNALRQAFTKYCKDRGVEKSSIHGLRHTFAKLWIKNNGNTFVLQQILGHSTLDMSRKYVKLYREDLKEDFELFNPLDNLKKKAKRTQTVKRSI